MAAPTSAPTAAAGGDLPSVAELASAMTETVLSQLKGVAKAIYTAGHFVEVTGGVAVFALSQGSPLDRAELKRGDVEAALRTKFGRPVPLRLVDGGVAGPGPASSEPPPPEHVEEEHSIDVADLTDAHDVVATGADKLTQAFPGAVVVDEESGS